MLIDAHQHFWLYEPTQYEWIDESMAALRQDDRFYQAAYDRALVLLPLGRGDDALRSFLIAARWASPPLTEAQRHEFLERLEKVAEATGRPLLAHAARSAIAR